MQIEKTGPTEKLSLLHSKQLSFPLTAEVIYLPLDGEMPQIFFWNKWKLTFLHYKTQEAIKTRKVHYKLTQYMNVNQGLSPLLSFSLSSLLPAFSLPPFPVVFWKKYLTVLRARILRYYCPHMVIICMRNFSIMNSSLYISCSSTSK